jgi:hypothetical protein
MVRTKRPGGPLQQRDLHREVKLSDLKDFDCVDRHNMMVFVGRGYTFLVRNQNGRIVGRITTRREIAQWVEIAQG